MDSLDSVTTWDPPHRFTADSRDDMQPGDPTIAHTQGEFVTRDSIENAYATLARFVGLR